MRLVPASQAPGHLASALMPILALGQATDLDSEQHECYRRAEVFPCPRTIALLGPDLAGRGRSRAVPGQALVTTQALEKPAHCPKLQRNRSCVSLQVLPRIFPFTGQNRMFNWIKTFALMAAITALFGVIGASLGGKQGMLMALGFAVVSNFFAYWFSDKMVLKMYNAREVDAASAP